MNILKEWQRLCVESIMCSYCPIQGTCIARGNFPRDIDMDAMEREITEWAKANPLKTCLDDFKEKFPNMRQTMEPWPSIHPWNLGYDVPRDMKAKEAWYLPMEEQAMEKTKEALKLELEQVKREREQLLKLAEKGQSDAKGEWPQEGDDYYFLTSDDCIEEESWYGDEFDCFRYDVGNMFRTEEEAEWYSEHLKVCAELRRMADGSVEDGAWYVPYYDSLNGHIFVYMRDGYSETPYIFASDESAQKAIDTIGEERLKKYWFRVED